MKDSESYDGFLVCSGGSEVTEFHNAVKLGIKLTDGAVMPIYSNPGDSGADLHSIEDLVIPPMERRIVRTGLYFEIPFGYEIQIRSRSGLAAKRGLFVLNSPGTIDSGYKNEVKIILQNLSNEGFAISKGDRIAQMVIASVTYLDFIEIDNLSESVRGKGGFGSTGV